MLVYKRMKHAWRVLIIKDRIHNVTGDFEYDYGFLLDANSAAMFANKLETILRKRAIYAQ